MPPGFWPQKEDSAIFREGSRGTQEEEHFQGEEFLIKKKESVTP